MTRALLLSVSEETQLAECEETIERGLKTFVDVGQALLRIRDAHLYRAQYGTFEDYCRERWGMSQPRAYQMMHAAQTVGLLQSSTIVELPQTESQARPLTQLPPDVQPIIWQRAVETAPNGKITAAHVQSVVDEYKAPETPTPATPPHVSYNSGNNEWYTPAQYADAARRVMGGIDLDPASTSIANEVIQATTFYTVDEDGLKHEWSGRVWMNPPYASELIGQFADKLAASDEVTEAIVLVNNATETRWFRQMVDVASAVCFPTGRVRFWSADRESATPLQGQAIIYIGQNVERFRTEFAAIGWSAIL